MKNFGKIKRAYVKVMIEGFVSGNHELKTVYANFVNNVKSNPILLKQQQIYSSLSNMNDIDKKDDFINECLNRISDNDRSSFIRENVNLMKPLFDYSIDVEDDYDTRKLDEAITRIIYAKSLTKESINRVVGAKEIIKENTSKDIKKSNIVLPTKTLVESYRLKLKNTYSNLSNFEQKILESIMLNDEENMKELFEEAISKTKDKVKLHLDNESANDVLTKLNEMKYDSNSFQEEITKILELQKSIS